MTRFAEPVYGGTGGFVSDLPYYDEPGYIATPPCMWGREEDGLAPPLLMNGLTLRVVAVTNNTYGHHGEMALPQTMIYNEPKKPQPPSPPAPPAPHCAANDTVSAQVGWSNIFGKVSSPGRSSSSIKYLGSFATLTECQQEFQAQGLQVYTYVTTSFAPAEWREGCYASLDGVYAPRQEAGVVSGVCQLHH